MSGYIRDLSSNNDGGGGPNGQARGGFGDRGGRVGRRARRDRRDRSGHGGREYGQERGIFRGQGVQQFGRAGSGSGGGMSRGGSQRDRLLTLLEVSTPSFPSHLFSVLTLVAINQSNLVDSADA